MYMWVLSESRRVYWISWVLRTKLEEQPVLLTLLIHLSSPQDVFLKK